MFWNFPSRDNGQNEGYSNPGLEWFKGDPLKALAREVCQNSLDACDDESEPVRIEFQMSKIPITKFPGLLELKDPLNKCKIFPFNKADSRAQNFINNALELLGDDKVVVLRISDFNTIGLQGAFKPDEATPWASLVKSTAISIKPDSKGAGGSFGIGKAAVFINSAFQTAFYRTKDLEGVEAAQGVAHLMSFKEDNVVDKDPVRRAVGFYGDNSNNSPVKRMQQLDDIYKRELVGTDIFIPGFMYDRAGKLDWISIMVGEILENFLMSIYYNKLNVVIGNVEISKDTLSRVLARYKTNAKNAFCFNKILELPDEDVIFEQKQFHKLGMLRLRLNYSNESNKQVLVVRKTGMKIAEIGSLPKGIAFSGILELMDDDLNDFFKQMENPQHDKWEPARHSNPTRARLYKAEVEEWVRKTITKVIEDQSGSEVEIDIGDVFAVGTKEENGTLSSDDSRESILDSNNAVTVSVSKHKRSTVKNTGGKGDNKVKGEITDDGELTGHRHRTGRNGGKPTGRTGIKKRDGEDTVYAGLIASNDSARVISKMDGTNRLIFTSGEDATDVRVDIVTIGENGKELLLWIKEVVGGNASVVNGHIVLPKVMAGEKNIIDFKIKGEQKYAVGVKIYGN